MFQPASAKAQAIWRPMRCAAPVISTTGRRPGSGMAAPSRCHIARTFQTAFRGAGFAQRYGELAQFVATEYVHDHAVAGLVARQQGGERFLVEHPQAIRSEERRVGKG